MQKRIYYYDTDCGGVVYYANYLKFLEEARTDYLDQRGISVKALMDQDIMFVVYRQEIDYKYPCFYGDMLNIETRVTNVSEIRIEFEYEIRNQDNRLTTKAKTIMVSVDAKLQPKALAPELRAKLTRQA